MANDELSLLQQSFNEMTEESTALGEEILNVFDVLNIDLESIPSDIKEGLDKVSTILRSEGLLEIDKTALTIIKQNQITKEMKKQRKERELSAKYDELYKKFLKFQKKTNYLNEALDTALTFTTESNAEEGDSVSTKIFFSKKLDEYQQTLENLEADLAQMKLDEIYPECILENYERYLEMKGRLIEINESLKKYGDLPPNLLQAKTLLEEKKIEYEKIQEEFKNMIKN
ncbi:uncharacterized protein [Prorops nasuta]|uniref:uncharacterized protein n=1 Tax=Prorops nasuta TaxID=863751 RepID=UPI0034CE159B